MMKEDVITKIEPVWYHGFANRPGIDVAVNKDIFVEWEWIYEPIPRDKRENVFLLSYNNWPWVRYVYIADPTGDPTRHGALGGEYKLTDGTVLKSKSGWSSRASVVNSKYTGILDDVITEVGVALPGRAIKFAGLNLPVTYLEDHPLFPEGLFMVPDTLSEPAWYISTSPGEVTKPDVSTVS
jgi:hypothetical protein